MLYFLTKGNPSKIKALEETSYKKVYDYYYLSRVESLNKLYQSIAQLKEIKELENK